jgi:hypothetical protein
MVRSSFCATDHPWTVAMILFAASELGSEAVCRGSPYSRSGQKREEPREDAHRRDARAKQQIDLRVVEDTQHIASGELRLGNKHGGSC